MVDEDNASWREKGVGNWARDNGFVMTKEGGLYNLWSTNPFMCVLDRVGLPEVEGFLETL